MNKDELKRTVEDLVDKLFMRAVMSPTKSLNLPKDEVTVAQAVAEILNLIAQDRKEFAREIIGEDE